MDGGREKNPVRNPITQSKYLNNSYSYTELLCGKKEYN
jgi:hypothetical protein